MAKKLKSPPVEPSQREIDVLKVLWKRGESKVRDVHEAMSRDGKCAFTTVQTLLRIMADKGLVKQRNEARTLFYTANYTPQNASRRFLRKVFDGSMDKLVLSMLQAEDVSAEELRSLEKLIADARKDKQSKPQRPAGDS